MNILAIETSCDDTCAAIVKAKGQKRPYFKILSNIVSSQVEIHKKWGGVYPSLAKREHQKNLPVVLKRALNKAGSPKIDFIAITVGPGLEPCLWVGVNFAKELAKKMKLPIIPVNHIEAHILANFVGENSKFEIRNSKFRFPAICLVVSGGHTQLILMEKVGQYRILGETRDDAAGECFDKTARILGLGYPGGPAIAAEAAKFKILKQSYGESPRATVKFKIVLPRPMIYQKNYDFSFSGLKTAVLYKVKSAGHEVDSPQGCKRKALDTKGTPRRVASEKYIRAMCAEIQQAIIDVLISKTLKAAKEFNTKSIILGGGVAANEELRKQFNEKIKKEIPNSLFLIPNSKFCTDNAAMIAAAGYYHWLREGTRPLKDIEADANLRIS